MPPISTGGATPPPAVAGATGGGPAASTPVPAVAGQAGDAAAGANALGGGAPGSIAEVLTRLVDTLRSLVATLGGAPVTAGGPGSSATPGESTMSLLDSASKGGSTDVAQSARRLADAFRPIASSIDASEAQLVTQAFQNASQFGHVRLADEIRLIVQVDGTAKGISPDYLAASNKVIDVIARSNEKFDALMRKAETESAQTGQVNQVTIYEMNQASQEMHAISGALNATYGMAATDPAAALARVTQASQQTDPATVYQALVQPRTA
jgi:hypothetical protein